MGSISVMDWNSKTASEWEWENLGGFQGKTNISNWVQSSNNESEGDGGIDNASMHSSGGGGFSGSDLGHVISSKSSISASGDSSLKEGMRTYGTSDSYSEDSNGKKELTRVESVINFPSSGASTVSGKPIIGLKLRKHTYFEDVFAASTTKASSFTIVSPPSVATTKRSRASYQSSQTPRCQVEGCNLDLKSAKDYHRRHRICENHSKSQKVILLVWNGDFANSAAGSMSCWNLMIRSEAVVGVSLITMHDAVGHSQRPYNSIMGGYLYQLMMEDSR